MLKFYVIILTITILTACSGENSSEDKSTPEGLDLKSRISQLEKENAQKDSMINVSLEFYNEIQSNLEAIELKKDELRIVSLNPEITPDTKKWMLEQIKHINFLREENAKKVVMLNKKLKENGLKIKELDNMVESLLQNIQARDEQISILQEELGSLDQAYSKLFDAYQEKAELVSELTEELNTVYYSYGTEDELVKNQVIERKNGFVGIGKKIKLLDAFNDKYFAKIDLTQDLELFVEGQNLKFITDHPSNSYKLILVGKNTKIKIVNPRDFWKVTKYLVIVVD